VEEQRQVEIFSFEHGLDVKDFVNRYMGVVRDALDALWGVVRWEMRGAFGCPRLRDLNRLKELFGAGI
jgi:hypothetical protein